MKRNYQNIDQVFRDNFSDHAIKPSSDHWDSVYQKVQRKNFFSTDLTRFNFIYSLLIISTFGFSIAAFVCNFKKHKEVVIQKQLIEITDTTTFKTVYIHDTIVNYVNIKAEPKPIEIDTASIISEYLNSVPQTIIQPENQEQTSIGLPETDLKDTVKNMRIIYRTVEKRDTVIKYMEKPDRPKKSKNLFEKIRNNK